MKRVGLLVHSKAFDSKEELHRALRDAGATSCIVCGKILRRRRLQ